MEIEKENRNEEERSWKENKKKLKEGDKINPLMPDRYICTGSLSWVIQKKIKHLFQIFQVRAHLYRS